MDRKTIITVILVTLAFLIGTFFRVYRLDQSPPSLNWDEAAWGYNAYSLALTGRDEYGVFMPIFTRSFDEYKSTLPMYLMIPSISIFGLNEIGVRMPSAIVGSLMIPLVAILAFQLFRSYKIAALAAFFLSIEPWAVHLSRVYHDANEALFFLLLGLVLAIASAKRPVLLILASVALIISMYTYNSNKVIVPLFVIGSIVISYKRWRDYPRRILVASLGIWGISVFIFGLLALMGQSLARVDSTNIIRTWNGNLWEFLQGMVGRYLAYFSPANLFVREALEPSTVVPNFSIFHTFEFFGWIVGLFYLFKQKSVPKVFYLLLFIAPLPAAFTWNWFQPGRGLTIFLIYTVCVALGTYKITSVIKNNILQNTILLSIVIFSLLNSVLLFDAEIIQLPARDTGNWQPGFKETVPTVLEEAKSAQKVIIDTPQAQPYIFYLFYGKYSPAQYQMELDLTKIGTPRKSFDFGKFEFRKINHADVQNKNTVLVISRERPGYYDFSESEVESIKEIKDKSGFPISRIIRTKTE